MKENTPRALVSLIIAMLIYGTIGVFRRYIPLSSPMLAFVRGALGTLFIALYVKLRGRKLFLPISKRSALLLVVSGFAIGINWMLLFDAYKYTSVATATLCYYMEPTIVILLSPLLFGEKLTGRKFLCALCALVGMILVSGITSAGGIHTEDMKGVFCGLGAACFYAFVIILNKLISGIDAYEKTAIQLGSAAIIMIPYLLLHGETIPSGMGLPIWILVLIVGFIHTGIAYVLYFGSINDLKAQTASILGYVDPVTALILSFLFLKEPLSITGLIGAVLILGAALISEK